MRERCGRFRNLRGDRSTPGVRLTLAGKLDDGAEEAVIPPSAEVADVLTEQLIAADSLFYDVGRNVLMVRGLK